MSSSLLSSLDRVESQARILNILPSLGSKHDVGVECCVPSSQKSGLNLGILAQASLANLLLGQSILLQRRSKRVLTFGVLCQGLRARQRSARDGVVECLGLRLRGGRSSQGGLGFGGGTSLREKSDLLIDRTA